MTDRKTTGDDEALQFECELPDPPEKVWRALTTPALLAAWLGARGFCAQIGARFQVEDKQVGPIDCQVLALEPPRLMRCSWRERRTAAEETIVTWSLTPTIQRGTLLRIVHAGAVQLRERAPRALATLQTGVPHLYSGSWRWAA